MQIEDIKIEIAVRNAASFIRWAQEQACANGWALKIVKTGRCEKWGFETVTLQGETAFYYADRRRIFGLRHV